jgi:hypothetical protein
MKKLVVLGILLISLFGFQSKSDSFDEIAGAMKLGQVGGLTQFFSSSVELTLLDNEGIYSKQQAEQMLRTFFNQHPPKSVSIQHKGSSGQGAKYAIIIYEAINGKFRSYIFMKDNGKGMQVNEFKLERE